MACNCPKCGSPFVVREHVGNIAKRKLIDVPHERPDEQFVKRRRTESEKKDLKTIKTEPQVEASSTVTRRVNKENPLKRKWMDVPQVPDPRPERTAEEKRTETDKKDEKTKAIFLNGYELGNLLGKGGYGSIYAGVRRSDGKKVALKFILKNVNDKYITVPDDNRRLPAEVALLELVCKPPRCPYVIELLEWFETPTGFIIILERPDPCVNLLEFCRQVNMSECMAKIIMQQVIQAACHCHSRGVFHRDIKAENILIDPRTLEVKLIDFGCGDLHKDTPYNEYLGTMMYLPPEWFTAKKYEAEPATVWGLGVLLYSMLCELKPFTSPREIVYGHQTFPNNLSRCSCSLISWCLQKDPKRRPTLQQMMVHDWFLLCTCAPWCLVGMNKYLYKFRLIMC